MGRKPKSRPSFYKVIFNELTNHLRLPHVFVQKYRENLPKSAKLRISSGETWNVELEDMGDEEFCFTRGWTKFSADIGLKMWEFLVFYFNVGNSTFDVSVYGPSGCERQISTRDKGSDSDEDEVVLLSQDVTSINHNIDPQLVAQEEAHPQFQIYLKPHHRSRLTIHKKFALAAGLASRKSRKAVVLQYPPDQRCWPVLLDHDFPKLPYFRLDMARGWPEFMKKNGLKFMKTYLFEYIPDKNVIEVKLVN
ncbi:hypothetical protein CDL12_28293 [Handroanthus impetiginosus]|uniref:TF-B3 domain-containing protein n=1 Tax=Handroanthus impetiginosus TaxID=429701 RepID=A0A2G9G1Q8_9LAMI|nr:hypothetical protein CDL12_28293 [Handroanthus impetiginosus]